MPALDALWYSKDPRGPHEEWGWIKVHPLVRAMYIFDASTFQDHSCWRVNCSPGGCKIIQLHGVTCTKVPFGKIYVPRFQR